MKPIYLQDRAPAQISPINNNFFNQKTITGGGRIKKKFVLHVCVILEKSSKKFLLCHFLKSRRICSQAVGIERSVPFAGKVSLRMAPKMTSMPQTMGVSGAVNLSEWDY